MNRSTFRIANISAADAVLPATGRLAVTIQGPGAETGLSLSLGSEQEAAAVVAALSLAYEYGRLMAEVPLQ